MEELLYITQELFRFNNSLQKKIFLEDDVLEEIENFDELVDSRDKLQKLILKLSKNDLKNEEEFTDDILELHLKILNFKWYFWNMSENLEKLITAGFDEGLLDAQQVKNVKLFFEEFNRQKNCDVVEQ